MATKDRLIQFVLRGKDEMSPEVKKATEAVDGLSQEAERLGQTLDSAKGAQGLAASLKNVRRAVEQAEGAIVQGDLQIKELRDALDKAPGSEGLQQSLKDAEREARRAHKQLAALRSELADTEQAARAAGVDTDNLADEQQRLAADVTKAKAALETNNVALKAAQRELAGATRAAAEHRSRLESARAAMSSGAKQALAFAAAYISLNAAFSLVGQGLRKVRDGIYSMLDTGDQFEKLGKRMASLMGSVEAGEQATAWIKRFAKETPLEVADVAEAFALLKSYGLDPMDGTLQALVDKNEQLGGGMERLQGIASALGQAYAKQKLQTEEILQLVERGVPVWGMLEKITGKNAAQLSKLASEGRLGRDVIAALTKEIGASAEGAAAEGMGTLTGLVSNLRDTWSDFLDRIAKSGALDYAKQQLKGVADYIEQMDKDGRLDKLAKSLATAFEQGAEKVKEFIGRIAEVDLNKLIDDSSAWFSDFGAKLESAATSVQLFVAPFRTLFNGVTSGLSAIGAALTGTWGLMLGAVEAVADKIPDALGGEKIKAAVAGARETLNGLRDGFVAQIEQDGQDIRAAWDTTTQSAVKNAKVQQEAAQAAEKAKADAAQATADKVSELNERFAAQAIAAAATGQRAIEGMADALQLINSASTVEQLEALRRATLRAFSEGRLSIEEYQQATGVLNGRFKELGSAAGSAAGLVSDLDDALGDLAAVQAAISNAKTDVDINAIRAALRTLYQDGAITAAQYNEELKKTSDRQKELRGAVEQGSRAQQQKNQADKEAIVTSEQLRRESGKRMEEERRAGDAAMQARRKGSEEAKRDMSAMEGFFGKVMSAAREPLAAMSAAALEAYDRLRGISSASPSIDTSSLEATSASLGRVSQQLGEVQKALSSPLSGPFGRWMLETQQASLQTQQAFLSQKSSLQSLLRSYERGGMSARSFIEQARNAKVAMGLLDDSDLSALESAIASAQQRMQQMAESTRSTLSSLQDELDGLQGRQDDIERRRFAGRRRELQAQLAEAQAGGDSQAVANASRALGLLRQIESESDAKRQAEAQRARQEEQTKAKEAKEAKPAPAQAEAPSRVIRLEVPGRAPVDVAVRSTDDETKLLGILESAGLRSL